MANYRSFPQILRHERELRGWSQNGLASLIVTTPVVVSRWERGVTIPGPYYQQKLSEVFGKTIEQLGLIDITPSSASVGSIESSSILTKPVSLFCICSHEDSAFGYELNKHLSPLQRQGLITAQHSHQIMAGADWAKTLDQYLNTAQLILPLISTDFMASDYCYHALSIALKRHSEKTAVVVPIILRPVHWENAPFHNLRVLPKEGKPVTMWANQDEVFLDIAWEVNQVVQRLLDQPTEKTKEQWTLEGKALYDTQQYEKALAAYEQALLLDRKDELIYSSIGRIHLNLGHHEAALEAYEQSIHLSSTASAYLFKGMILQRLGKPADALGAYQKAREHGYQE